MTVWMAFLTLTAAPLSAQTNRGGIAGTIFDPLRSVVGNAKVQVTNVGTGQTTTVTSSAEGRYAVDLLEPVSYRITVEAKGFKTAVLENVKVDTSSISTANVTLEPGAIATTVTVSAEVETVNAESGVVSQTITQRQIENMPLTERSVLDLVQTVPNVSGDLVSETPGIGTGQISPGAGISVAGGRPGGGGFLADGADNTAVGIGRTVVSFTPDVVQEFTVQTSAFSAEYGKTGGGIINITTKSGSNQFHGTAYFFQRNPSLNAAPYTIATTNRPYSNRRQTQVGVTIGGPVRIPKLYNGRNKTFFFFAFEPQRITDSTSITDLMPTSAMRGGDFSNVVPLSNGYTTADVAKQFNIPTVGDATIYQAFQLQGTQLVRLTAPTGTNTFTPFPGNVVPQQWMDPTSLKLMQYLPQAGAPFLNSSGQLANWAGQRTVYTSDNRYSMRFDESVTSTDRVSFRWTHVPISGYRGGADFNPNSSNVNALIGDLSSSNQFVVSYTRIFSPTLVNDLRLNYTRGNFSRVNPPEWQTQNLATQLGLPSLTTGGLPYFQFTNPSGSSQSWAYIGQQNITSLGNEIDETNNFTDTLSKTHGNMTIKMGVDVRLSRMKTVSSGLGTGGQYYFASRETSAQAAGGALGGVSWASFLIGSPEQYQFINSIIPYYYRWAGGAAFLQNDWRVRSNLTLNLGMRYQLDLPRWEKANRQGVFLPGLAQTVNLATPISLPTGQTITTATIPPFGFSGYGGRSRYLFPIDYREFEPRFGFAWTPLWAGFQHRLVVRGGYGITHAPITGQGSTPNPNFAASTQSYNYLANNGQANSAYAMRLSSNPPAFTAMSPDQLLNIPANGLVTTNSLAYQGLGWAIDPHTTIPYVQNWNLTTGWQLDQKTILEVGYMGVKGTKLFAPPENLNEFPFGLTQAYTYTGVDPQSTITDPLGRKSLTGTAISVPRGSLGSTYLGFNNLLNYLDSSANSIRHSGYLYLNRRLDHGLYVSGSYTYAKSIDDASDSGASAGAGGTGSNSFNYTGNTGGQARLGAPRSADRSVSVFDIRHQVSANFSYDLPFGPGHAIWHAPPSFLKQVVGGWTLTGLGRVTSSYPFQALLGDNNGLDQGGSTGYIRYTVLQGVPLLNPLYSSKCPVLTTCQPYVNPAAFLRPAYGTLGDGPRTYDGIRGPMKKYLNLSMQKNIFPFGHDTKKRFQFRIDAINVLNHPNFVFNNDVSGASYRGSKLASQSSLATLTTSEYNTWAQVNSQPLYGTTGGTALYNQIENMIVANRIAGATAMPSSFFSIRVPEGFTQMNANSFDITTLNGYKDYRLAQTWDQRFGTLSTTGEQPRLVQFSARFTF